MSHNDKYIKKLNDQQYRLTKSRMEILNCFNDDFHSHSIQDIVNHIKSRNKTINTASVYNTIDLLIKEGLVDIYANYESKNQLYEIVDKNNLHIHINCIEQKKNIKEKMPESVKKELIEILNKHNLDFHNIKIEILAKPKDD
ncbi:Fur family transcriptional regulator [Malacoplasma iowae]|uniref:Fur family transcriptional regulator n=1 Tax=Malacoplasma iowae TaxID=2116 RepID=UPI00387399B3|nr:transcriptional repressor [Malacoplasma iowae]